MKIILSFLVVLSYLIGVYGDLSVIITQTHGWGGALGPSGVGGWPDGYTHMSTLISANWLTLLLRLSIISDGVTFQSHTVRRKKEF